MLTFLSFSCGALVLFAEILLPVSAQWDPNNPLYGEPQWIKPRRKRTPGADEKWPPWYAPECPPDLSGPCQLPPYYPYDPIRRELPHIGIITGRSMAYKPYRYINLFLGVPYAKPPVYERRFKPPMDLGPNFDMAIRNWDASYYRDACPQELYKYQHLYYTPRNMSEDCLHLNIFAPNLTDRPEFINRKYPIMVIIPGEDYINGDSMLYPAHILARKEVLVVTFNYRLGALGFMSTLDNNSPGNYGLLDIIKVLKFIQQYIEIFGGDPNKVTLVGFGSGAAAIGILLVSPKAKDERTGKQLFHQVVLMSGSDLCEWSYVGKIWNADALTYARDLGKRVGCVFEYDPSNKYVVECLSKKHYEEMVNATAAINKRYGSLSGPFGPVVDGLYGILPDTPKNLRDANKFLRVKVIAGITKDEGAYYARNLTKGMVGVNMENGLDPGTFRDIITEMVQQRAAIRNIYEVVGAIEFEYTYWAKPDNKSAVRQNLVDLWSDFVYGSCVDAFLKSQTSNCEPNTPDCPAAYMYMFAHRSEFEPLPFWMGNQCTVKFCPSGQPTLSVEYIHIGFTICFIERVPHGRDVDYLLGYPFYNETLGNITGIVPEQSDWTYVDRNVSDFMQDMWLNFTKYGVPTPDWTRNISWYQFYKYNLSYLHISEFSYMNLDYRQNHYAFWREYFPSVSIRHPVTTTPQPTPRPRVEYQIATWSLVGASFITLIVIVSLGITLWLRTRAM